MIADSACQKSQLFGWYTRRLGPSDLMVYISRMNKLECVPQPVEARISENAPRGAREREFSSGLPPSGSKSKARPWTPFPEQLADLPSPPAGQQQQEAPHCGCRVGTSRKQRHRPGSLSPRCCCWGTPAWLRNTQLLTPRGIGFCAVPPAAKQLQLRTQ